MYTDFLIKIKNARLAEKKILKTKFTKMDKAIAEILESANFLKKIDLKGKPPKKMIEIELDGKKRISGLKFLSRPSLRRYVGYKELRTSKGGRGLIVISTSKGILTSIEAKKQKVGGQLLFEIW